MRFVRKYFHVTLRKKYMKQISRENIFHRRIRPTGKSSFETASTKQKIKRKSIGLRKDHGISQRVSAAEIPLVCYFLSNEYLAYFPTPVPAFPLPCTPFFRSTKINVASETFG